MPPFLILLLCVLQGKDTLLVLYRPFFEAFLNGTSNVVYYSILLPSYLWRLGPSVRGRKVRQLANKQQQQQ